MSMSRDQQLAATLAAIEDTDPTDIQVCTDGSIHDGGDRDGGYEWGRHHQTVACANRPMEQLVPSGEISDGESNLVAR